MGQDYIPKRLGEYREKEYWNHRYEKDKGTYDWLLSYKNIRPLLLPHMTPTDRILNLGCGNSLLSEEMHSEGFKSIINIDYSETVISSMKERTGHLLGLEWHTMDMRQLLFTNDSFNLVIDKGSLDAIWTDGGSVWQPSLDVCADVEAIIDEIIRVLQPGGKFVSISFGQPHFRLPLLKRESWTLTSEPISDTFYFIYIGHKH